MRIRYVMEGGIAFFPGLSKPVTIDSRKLPEAEARELERRVQAARFFDQPPQPGPIPRGAADYRQYTLTIQEGSRRHTVQLVDPVEDPNLQALLEFVQAQARSQREAKQGHSTPPSPDKPT
ncbi:MAG: hypothetical protein A2Z04_04300 [Chloroflexi bacterium RBG_16_57_9]|nr:MAG: hypothetical protein A2Z04_04300 [Chloroflexi bacterium RBG_16_57_9]